MLEQGGIFRKSGADDDGNLGKKRGKKRRVYSEMKAVPGIINVNLSINTPLSTNTTPSGLLQSF